MRAPVNSGVTDIVLVFQLHGSPEPFYLCCQRKHAAAIEELLRHGLQNELRSDARRAEDPSSIFVESHDSTRCGSPLTVEGLLVVTVVVEDADVVVVEDTWWSKRWWENRGFKWWVRCW